MKNLVAIIYIFSISSLFAQGRVGPQPDDVDSIDNVMTAYYESVSGHPGKRDIERILNLYAPNAKLNVNVQDALPVHGTVEDVVISERFLNITTEFFEREISRDTQQFRNMAQIISTYGISDAMENTNYTARGVTVFQMYYAGDRWWILSSLFERESDDVPLPAHLLD